MPSAADATGAFADAGESAPCTPSSEVAPSYSDTGLASANDPWNEAEGYWEVSANLAGAGGPVIVLRLHPGRGQFPDPIVPGTYTIGNADSRLEDCALCAYVIVEGVGATSYYVADSGTLTLSTIAFGDIVDVIEGELLEATLPSVALSATGPSCRPGDECGNTSCASSGSCFVQEETDKCGTLIGQFRFRTP